MRLPPDGIVASHDTCDEPAVDSVERLSDGLVRVPDAAKLGVTRSVASLSAGPIAAISVSFVSVMTYLMK